MILLTINQCLNFTLKERWFWADSKKTILFIYHNVWKVTNLYINIKRWLHLKDKRLVFQRSVNVEIWVDSKKLLSLTIIQRLRTVTLNDICSDLICLRKVVFSWYFMKVSRKWSEETSIFSKLQVYENIHEVFSFSITWKANFCNNVQISLWWNPFSLN